MNTQINWERTALLVVDPQQEMLSSRGGAWDLVGDQVSKRNTVAHLRRLRDAASDNDLTVMYSWLEVSEAQYNSLKPQSGIVRLLADRKLFLPQRGSLFVEELEPTAETIVLKPRQGPSSIGSDLFEQLEASGIETIIIAGMIANLCVDSQTREAVAEGYNVIVVTDAIGTISDEAHDAAVANFGLIATDVTTTDEIVGLMPAAAV